MQYVRRKKVCFLGASAVGKTSLIAGYSGEGFSSEYQSTLGVRVTTAVVTVSERLRELVVWDIKGETEFYRIPPAYVWGCHGYILVADGTRLATLEHALSLRERMMEIAGDIPHILLINKIDLSDIWEIDNALLSTLQEQAPCLYTCSARGGITIHTAMEELARRMWGVK